MGRPSPSSEELGRNWIAPAKKPARAPQPGDPDPEDDIEMSFMEHLRELRTRILYSLIGIVPGVALGWMLKEQLLAMLARPLHQAYEHLNLGQAQLHFANPIDPFLVYLKIAVVCGIIFAGPWIFYQMWAFIAPGLYRREKRLALPFVLASTVFFVGGAFFGYLLVLPPAFEMFLDFSQMLPSQEVRITPTIMMADYIDFATRLLLAFGVTFEVPVIVSFLSFAGIVNWKQLLGFSRWWIVIASIIAAVLTPPDVGSQLMMLVPLIVLYFLSIALAWAFGPTPPKEESEPADEEAS